MGEWKERSVQRRDFRHTHDGPEITGPPKPKKHKKNTKRWCRGKEGKEHKPVKVRKWGEWYVYRCTECGKELDYYWRSRYTRMPKPDWMNEDTKQG